MGCMVCVCVCCSPCLLARPFATPCSSVVVPILPLTTHVLAPPHHLQHLGCCPSADCALLCVAVRRTLRRLTLQDAAEASHTLTLLMGDQVAPRRKMIEEYGSQVNLEQLDI